MTVNPNNLSALIKTTTEMKRCRHYAMQKLPCTMLLSEEKMLATTENSVFRGHLLNFLRSVGAVLGSLRERLLEVSLRGQALTRGTLHCSLDNQDRAVCTSTPHGTACPSTGWTPAAKKP